MSSLRVKTDNEHVELINGTGTKVFQVTNESGRPLRIRGECLPLEDCRADWLSLSEGDTRGLPVSGDVSFKVQVTPDAKAISGTHKFYFRAFDIDNPADYW